MKVVAKSFKIIAYMWIGLLSFSVSAQASTIDKYITETRTTLPKQVDQVTTWTAIKRSGDRIIYTKEIDLSYFKPEAQKLLLDNLDKLEAQVKKGLAEMSCKDKAIRYLLDANYTMTHLIYTTDDKHLFDVNINRSMCNDASIAMLPSVSANDADTYRYDSPDDLARIIANEMAKDVPQQIDKYTSMISVKVVDNWIIQELSMNLSKEQADKIAKQAGASSFNDKMAKAKSEELFYNSVCSVPDLAKFIDYGVDMSQIYRLKDGTYVFEITVTDCK